jgi:GUN4-like/TIR domain
LRMVDTDCGTSRLIRPYEEFSMTESHENPIFISYSRQDQGYVKSLIGAFEKRGLSVWLDDRIEYGSAWPQEIEKHLRACQVFVLVMTPRSYDSHWVQCELSFALDIKKPIFPLLFEGERWLSVSRLQVVDVKGNMLPPDRFFRAVSASIVGLPVSTDNVTASEPLAVASTVSLQEKVNWESLETENELNALRQELAELRAQQVKQPPSKPVDEVIPTKPIDARYADLERYLKNEQWEEADDETYRLMITEVGKKEGQWFYPEDPPNFPCEPLRAIDGLWVKHSGGKFGFSVQRELYLKCGGKPDGKHYKGAWDKFCESNGWKKNRKYVDAVKYDTSAPRGHLPAKIARMWSTGIFAGINGKDPEKEVNFYYLYFSRTQTCEL